MTDRTVLVRLGAVTTGFNAGMRNAARTASRTSASIRNSMNSASRRTAATMNRIATNQRTALKATRTGSLALIAAFGLAAGAAARFEKSMSAVKAVSGASGAELQKLRDAALEAGRTTQYSATQAADAEAELARAGIKTADIVGGGLTGALALAAAGQLDLTEAAITSAQAMNTFGLSGKDMSHVADVLAAGANKSATNVHQMGLAIKQGGLVAHQTGLSLEETAGAVAAFADHALVGSDAGTSLKVMLQRLTPQSKEAQATMDQLGFSAYDSQGKFVGLSELAGRLQKSFKNLTPEARNAAFGVIFGSDAVRGASILYQLGAKGVDEYTKKVNDQGYAMRTAATQMDNLIGDFELMKSALETALIQSGTAANGVLRDMVQWVTKLVNAYNGLPPELQSAATLTMGFVGALGLAGAGLLLLLPRIMTVKRELAALGVTAGRTRSAMGLLGKTGAIVAGVLAVSYAVQKIRDQFKGAPPDVSKLTNSMVDFAQKGKVSGEMASKFGDDLGGLSEAIQRVAHPSGGARATDVVNSLTLNLTKGLAEAQIPLDEAHDKLDAIDQSLAQLVSSGHTDEAAANFREFAKAANAGGTSTEKFLTLLPQYTDALASSDAQSKLAAGSQGDLATEIAKTKAEMQDQRSAAEKLTDSLKGLNGVNISAAEKSISFQQSLHDLTKTVKDNGHSLKDTSEKGRQVKSAFLDAAKAAMEHAQAVSEQKNSVAAGNAVLAKDIDALKRTMKQAGFTQKQIDALTEAYARLPESEATKVTAPGTVKATQEVEDLYRSVLDLPAGKSITIKAPTKSAIKDLRAAGYQVKILPGGKKITITAPTGDARRALSNLQDQINRMHGKSLTVHVAANMEKRLTNAGLMSTGGIVGHAARGLYIPGYAPRRDTELILASKGEGVLVPETVRALGQMSGLGSKGAVDALNRWGMSGARMPLGRGTPARTYASAAPVGAPPAAAEFDVHVNYNDPALRGLIDVQVTPKIRDSEQRQARQARTGKAALR
ncbi:phage tail tape measure protein [Streptomyces sp. MS06]|uniref:phage tail tape measure protein n=1 Tax=Streptomyces sp. MS06 TaxID=3385974 RepID=UPI0039A0C0B2